MIIFQLLLKIDLAKVSPHILNPEKFALHLATFFVSKYAHIHKAFVAIEQLRWARIPVDSGKEHPHAFYRDGDDKRVVKVEVDASKGKDKLVGRVSAGVSDLLGGLRVLFFTSPFPLLCGSIYLLISDDQS